MTTYKVGTLVTVQGRTWSGINKPGGVGAVCGVHCQDETEEELYDVKYVLGGQEKGVSLEFIGPYEDLAQAGRSSKRTRKGNSNDRGLDGVLKDSSKNAVSSGTSKIAKTAKSNKMIKSAKKVAKEAPKKAEESNSSVHDELIGLTVVFPVPQSSDRSKVRAPTRNIPISTSRPVKKKRDASIEDTRRHARAKKVASSKQALKKSLGSTNKDSNKTVENEGDTNMASVLSSKLVAGAARPEHPIKRQVPQEGTSTSRSLVKDTQKRNVSADLAARNYQTARQHTRSLKGSSKKVSRSVGHSSKAVNTADQQEPSIHLIAVSQEEKIEDVTREGTTDEHRLCAFTVLANKARFGRDEIHFEEFLKLVNKDDKQRKFTGGEALDCVKELQMQNKLMFCQDSRMIYFI